MCHPTCINFGKNSITREEINGKDVVEVGSFYVNGSLRDIVEGLGPARYVGVDIIPGPGVDEVCDARELLDRYGEASFDVLISTELLEHVRDWRKVISNFKRILRPGGVALASTRFIYRYHPDPHDYYRFAPDSLSYLFSGFSEVAVVPHGNGLHALWHIINNDWRPWRLLLNPLNGLLARIDFRSPGFPLGFIIRAVK